MEVVSVDGEQSDLQFGFWFRFFKFNTKKVDSLIILFPAAIIP